MDIGNAKPINSKGLNVIIIKKHSNKIQTLQMVIMISYVLFSKPPMTINHDFYFFLYLKCSVVSLGSRFP
jgi:hypothetical protein